MSTDDQIKETLEWLEKRYNEVQEDTEQETAIQKARIYSKMAILELSGWVEESNDKLVLDIANERLTDEHARKRYQNKVNKVMGFRYKSHFLRLIDSAIGVIKRELIEIEMDVATLQNFKNSLHALSESRDQLAHTFSHGTQEAVEGVNLTKRHFERIRNGLQAYKEAIDRIF